MLGRDYSYTHFLASSAEVKSYQLLPSIKQMGSFAKTPGFCCPFTPAAVMGFLLAGRLLPALCREPHVSGGGLWKGICSHFPVFEGVPGSGSLLTARPVFPYFLCASSSSGVVSCRYLAAFPSTPSCFDHNISSFLPMCVPLKNNLSREVSLL